VSIGRTITQGRDLQLIEGIGKGLPGAPTFVLGTTTYTVDSLIAFVQSRIDLANEVGTTKANWLATVKAYAAVNKRAKVVLADLRNHLIANFGADSSRLADFGFTAPRRGVLTPEQRAAAVAKGKATRKARKTLGKRQKAGIKGDVNTNANANAKTTANTTEIATA